MKRFYRMVTVEPTGDGFHILLDARPIRTPDKHSLEVPSEHLANGIAGEWQEQGEQILPETMPLTRLANTAIDRVLGRAQELVGEIAAYGASELVCYRASDPDDLVARQCAAWDPYLNWIKRAYGGELKTVNGIRPVEQTGAALKKLAKTVADHDHFELAALHLAVSLSGSLVIGLALAAGEIDADQAFRDSHLDELYQAEKWHPDPDAEQKRDAVRAGLVAAGKFLELQRVQ